MFIAILQGEEIENELEIIWHCVNCAAEEYGWSKEQSKFVVEAIANNKPFKVPVEVVTQKDFCEYIKSIKV